jgi:hypothetical protein
MPRRKLPPNYELVQMYRSGMTHQEMADKVSEQIGEPVTRVAITLALARIGEDTRNPRYEVVIPWRVKARHRNETAVRNLRMLGRRKGGATLTREEEIRVNNWLKWLDAHDAVVAYCPDRDPGFVYVTADEDGDRPDGLPIRPRVLTLSEFVV